MICNTYKQETWQMLHHFGASMRYFQVQKEETALLVHMSAASICNLAAFNLNPIVHFTSHCGLYSLCTLVCGVCVSRKDGTWEGGWGHLQGDIHVVAAWLCYESYRQKKKMLFSLCRGFIFGNKGCFGFEWVYDNRQCMDKIMSLLITARSGLGFSFGVGAWTELVC